MLQQDYSEVVDPGVTLSDEVGLGDTKTEAVDLGVGGPGGVVLGVAVHEVELGVALSDVVELGDAKPKVVELGDAKPEVVELGVSVSKVVELGLAVSEVELGVALFDVVELGDAQSEVRKSCRKGRSTYPFDRGNIIWARLAPRGWEDGSGSVWGGYGGGWGNEEYEGAGTSSSRSMERKSPFDPGKQACCMFPVSPIVVLVD